MNQDGDCEKVLKMYGRAVHEYLRNEFKINSDTIVKVVFTDATDYTYSIYYSSRIPELHLGQSFPEEIYTEQFTVQFREFSFRGRYIVLAHSSVHNILFIRERPRQ